MLLFSDVLLLDVIGTVRLGKSMERVQTVVAWKL